MRQPSVREENFVDDKGYPAGGFYIANGIEIRWQQGPLGRGADRKAPNGAFVEDAIYAALQRLEFYQRDERVACPENGTAIAHLKFALEELHRRTQRREAAQVEGTHQGC